MVAQLRKISHFFYLGIFFLIIFIEFSLIVKIAVLNAFDLYSIVFIQSIIPHALDTFFSLLSLLGSFEVLFLILILTLLFYKKITGIMAVFFFLAGHLVEFFGKYFLHHPGPPYVFFRYDLQFLFPSSFVQPGSSYPSGHSFRAVFLFVLLLYFILTNKKISVLKQVFFILLLSVVLSIILISRVSLGEHWTTDVIGGSLLGLSLSCFSLVFINEKWR